MHKAHAIFNSLQISVWNLFAFKLFYCVQSASRSRAAGAMECLEVDNRTPEDSVCSIEGPSGIYADGPSNASDTNDVQIAYKIWTVSECHHSFW